MDMTTCQIVLQAGKLVALCPVHEESFVDLLLSLPHWGLEVVIMVVFDGLVGALFFPFVKRHWKHHVTHDELHQGTAPDFGLCPICCRSDRDGSHPVCALVMRGQYSTDPHSDNYMGHNIARETGLAKCICPSEAERDAYCPFHGR